MVFQPLIGIVDPVVNHVISKIDVPGAGGEPGIPTLVMGEQVVVVRAVVVPPDAAELVALPVADGFRDYAVLNRRMAIVIEG